MDNLLRPSRAGEPGSFFIYANIKKMIKQLINFLRSYARGDDIRVEFEFLITWLDMAFIAVIIGLVIYLICR